MSASEHQAGIDVLLAENGAIGWVTTADRLLAADAGADRYIKKLEITAEFPNLRHDCDIPATPEF